LQSRKNQTFVSSQLEEDEADYMSHVIAELELRLLNANTEEARRELVRAFLKSEIAAKMQKHEGFAEYIDHLRNLFGDRLGSPADEDRNTGSPHLVLSHSDDENFDDSCEDILLNPFNEDDPIERSPTAPTISESATLEPSASQATITAPTISESARAESPPMVDVTIMTIDELFERVLNHEQNIVRRADFAATWLRSETGMSHQTHRALRPLIHKLLDMIEAASGETEREHLE